MKKTLLCSVVFFLLISVALFANRKEIDDVYKAYEAVIVEAENMAKKASVGVEDFTVLAEKMETLSSKAEKVRSDKDFTQADVQRFSALTERYQKALTTIMSKLKY